MHIRNILLKFSALESNMIMRHLFGVNKILKMDCQMELKFPFNRLDKRGQNLICIF